MVSFVSLHPLPIDIEKLCSVSNAYIHDVFRCIERGGRGKRLAGKGEAYLFALFLGILTDLSAAGSDEAGEGPGRGCRVLGCRLWKSKALGTLAMCLCRCVGGSPRPLSEPVTGRGGAPSEPRRPPVRPRCGHHVQHTPPRNCRVGSSAPAPARSRPFNPGFPLNLQGLFILRRETFTHPLLCSGVPDTPVRTAFVLLCCSLRSSSRHPPSFKSPGLLLA